MSAAEQIFVEVVYAEPTRQWLLKVTLPRGASVADALDASGIRDQVKGLQIDPQRVGIHGRKVSLEQPLEEGDRVEIYRPLLVDPKEIRRARAKQQALPNRPVSLRKP